MSRIHVSGGAGAAARGTPATRRALNSRSWRYAVRRTLAEFGRDGGADLAATLTHFTVLSIAPTLLAVFSISSLVLGSYREQISGALEAMLARVDLGEAYQTLVRDTVEQLLATAGGGSASLALLISGLLSVWLASGYVKAFSRVMNTIYGVPEGRSFIRQTGTMVLATVLILLCSVLILVAAVVSPAVLRPVLAVVAAPLGLADVAEFLLNSFLPVWNWVRWPVIVALVVMALAVLFHLAPNVARQRFRPISVGMLVAIAGMAIATAAMAVYITGLASYSIFGAIGTVMVALVALWVMNMGLVLGAELDVEVERARELAAGIAAEDVVQLPLRDDTNAVRADEDHEKLVDAGRDLRLAPLHTRGHDQ